MDFNDEELTLMFSENNEDAKNVLFEKYSYIIEIIMAKYKKSIYALGLDYSEVKQEAMLAFTDALIRYNSEKESSLPTFISVVVERKVQNCIRKAETIKQKVHNESYSIDYEYEAFKKPLTEIIADTSKEPLENLENRENYEELVKKINSALSPFEKDVYELLINEFNYQDIAKILNKEPKQIDNTIQRIRCKIKDLI
jgi:RNA polymerase sporulation-specific sigma factor